MKIFVLRHGMTSDAETDEARELTETGVAEVEKVVNLRLDASPNGRSVSLVR
jgi:phosphohistidine phosphatase SixA